jgi:hypothetical protein
MAASLDASRLEAFLEHGRIASFGGSLKPVRILGRAR